MATPSSSATSPSPPMAYLHHVPGPQQALQSNISENLERDQRKKAVDKFLARAEIAMVTRRLRAQLAYASYKATHNIPHVSLRDLEAQNQSQTASFNRTIAAKRKAVGATGHYQSPAQGQSSAGAGSLRRGGSTSMAPPASVSSPRPHSSSVPSTPGYANYNEITLSQRHSGQAPNLYASILAPPPTRQARTIHNPNDPPLAAPKRPTPSPKSRASKASPRNDPARPPSKSKQATKDAKATASPDRRRKKATAADKGKQKQRSRDMDVDPEMDLKAAATLTSLLLNHRPSIAGSASSPRSSIDGSEVGSAYSYSHFNQSSTRTSTQNAAPVSAAPSSSTLVVESNFRSQTPPPSGSPLQKQTTPRAAPTDSEAANLMLFLATSPSPVRPSNKDAKDAAAYRVLGGGSGPLRSKGRVLFPSNSATDRGSDHEEVPASSAGSSYRPITLARGAENSFASSISSIGSDLGGSRMDGPSSQAPPSATLPSQLLPPAPLPIPTAPNSPVGRKERSSSSISSPKSSILGVSASGGGSGNSVPLEFNFHEYINASPSPSRGGHTHGGGGVHGRSNLGLRADVGRKLFEEEQMRHAHALQAAAAAAMGPGLQDERPLGAGIDLIHS